jgi:hypothetical protein
LVTKRLDLEVNGAATSLAAVSRLETTGHDAPTVAGYEVSSFYDLRRTQKTPAEIIDRLNKEIKAGLSHPKIDARLADLGVVVFPGSPSAFGRLVAADAGLLVRGGECFTQGLGALF